MKTRKIRRKRGRKKTYKAGAPGMTAQQACDKMKQLNPGKYEWDGTKCVEKKGWW